MIPHVPGVDTTLIAKVIRDVLRTDPLPVPATVPVGEALELSPAALTDLKKQLAPFPAIAGIIDSAGNVFRGRGFTVTHPSAGNYTIKLNVGIPHAVAHVTPAVQSVVGGINIASATVFNVYMTTPAAWVDSAFHFVIYDLG